MRLFLDATFDSYAEAVQAVAEACSEQPNPEQLAAFLSVGNPDAVLARLASREDWLALPLPRRVQRALQQADPECRVIPIHPNYPDARALLLSEAMVQAESTG